MIGDHPEHRQRHRDQRQHHQQPHPARRSRPALQHQPAAAIAQHQRQHRNPGPAPHRIHRQPAAGNQPVIAVKPGAGGCAARHQKRCCRRPQQPHGGQKRAIEPAQNHRQRRRGQQARKGHFRPDQPVKLPRCDDAGKDRHQPRARKHRGQIGGGLIRAVAAFAPDPLARRNQPCAEQDRHDHPRLWRQQPVFHTILHEKHPRHRQ